MFGAGESYLSAFAIFLKASTPQVGLLVSLPGLLASFVQIFSAWLGKQTGQRKFIHFIPIDIKSMGDNFGGLPHG